MIRGIYEFYVNWVIKKFNDLIVDFEVFDIKVEMIYSSKFIW